MTNPVIASKHRLPVKMILIIVAGVCVLVAIGGFLYMRHTNQGAMRTTATTDELVEASPSNADGTSPSSEDPVFSEAIKDVQAGNTQAAIDRYSSDATTKQEDSSKAESYRSLSVVLFTYGNNQSEALKYALEAYKLDQSGETAAQLSVIYRAMGNDAEAIKYETYKDSLSTEGEEGDGR